MASMSNLELELSSLCASKGHKYSGYLKREVMVGIISNIYVEIGEKKVKQINIR